MKVLICEDEEILLTALEFRMRKAGFDVVLAKDGEIALQKIQSEDIDLVVADIEMPKMTGLELISALQKEEQEEQQATVIPVIVISALEHEEEIRAALKLGAKDFVAKPFKPAELVLRVKCILDTE